MVDLIKPRCFPSSSPPRLPTRRARPASLCSAARHLHTPSSTDPAQPHLALPRSMAPTIVPPAGIATGLMRLTWAPEQVRTHPSRTLPAKAPCAAVS